MLPEIETDWERELELGALRGAVTGDAALAMKRATLAVDCTYQYRTGQYDIQPVAAGLVHHVVVLGDFAVVDVDG